MTESQNPIFLKQPELLHVLSNMVSFHKEEEWVVQDMIGVMSVRGGRGVDAHLYDISEVTDLPGF